MKKRLLSMLLAGAMVFSLAACGGGSNDTSSKDDGASSADSNKLTVWAWDQTFNIKTMQMAGDLYAKDHEGFELEIIETSSDDCQTKLTTCANAGDYGTMADIVLMQDNSYQKFLKSYPDAFVDLTDITWSRFIEIGQDVHAKTGKYLLTSESAGGDTIMLMIQSCGANFVNENGEAYIVGNEVAEKCIDLYTEMIEKGVVKLVNNWDEYISSVTNGEAAGIVNGNWMNATLTGIEDQKGLWQITTLPAVDGVAAATNYANNGGSSW